MKFLFLTREDCSGVAHKLKVAADLLGGHSAHSVSMHRTSANYPEDLFRLSDAMLNEYREWADAIVMFDGWNRTAEIASGKPLAAVYNGSGYRASWRERNEQDRNSGIVQFGTTIDLTCPTYGSSLNWLPVPIGATITDIERTDDAFHVIHCPTHRGRKSTERIIDELDGLDGVRLEIVEGVTNEECMRRKAKAHLLIDQFYVGYGVNALEAWSLGLPVIAGCKMLPAEFGFDSPSGREICDALAEETGRGFPFYELDIDAQFQLRDGVKWLAGRPDVCSEIANEGVEHTRQFHSAEAVIGRLIAALERGVK